MPRNISGTYSLPEPAFAPGTTIQSASVNSDFSDIATALTESLATTGVSSMTGPIKAASGAVTAPSYTFASAPTTGFFLSGTNEFAWTAAGILAATFAATGAVIWAGAQTFQSATTFSSTILAAGITAANTTTPLTARNTTNDTSEHTLVSLELGSGAGTGASVRAVGAGANDVTTLRFYVGGVNTFELNSLEARFPTGIAEFVQIASTASATASTNRLYFTSNFGAYNDVNGVERPITPVGAVVGHGYGENALNAALTGNIPTDDTIPQVGEGDQIVTATITPKSLTNKIRARFNCFAGPSGDGIIIVSALFSSLSADAIDVVAIAAGGGGADVYQNHSLEVEHVPGSVAALTYQVRMGCSSGSYRINGSFAARKFGGAARATLILEEIQQ
jgi:hypothetical protein